MTTYTQEQKSFTAAWLLRFAKNEFSDHSIEVCHLVNAANMLAAPSASQPVAWALTAELTKRETTTRAHLWFSNPMNCMWSALFTTPQAAPSASPAPEMSELLGKFEEVLGNKTALHSEYQGKAMPDDVYAAFANLRDVRVPELRAQILAMMAAPSTSNADGVPLESSDVAAVAINNMLREYNYPANPTNAARAGWRACRLHTPQATPSTSAVAEFVADNDCGHVQLLAHEGAPLTDGQKLFATPQAAPSTNNELVEMAARLAESELRANQLVAQFKAQCEITAAALDERAKLAAPSTSPIVEWSWTRKYADSTPTLHVGNSAFEDWFQQQPFACQPDIKQLCRDSYAAGMGDPLVTYATPQTAPSPSMPFVPWAKEAEMLESWATPSTSPTVVRVCRDKDSVCGDNSRYWCNSCPKHTTGAQELADSGELMEAAVKMRAAMDALNAENNRFRAALTIIGNWGGTTRFYGSGSYTDVARAALGKGCTI